MPEGTFVRFYENCYNRSELLTMSENRYVNMVPQRQLEKISDPPKSVLKTVLWNDFFQALFCRITANFWGKNLF